jgi:hypothetical protein
MEKNSFGRPGLWNSGIRRKNKVIGGDSIETSESVLAQEVFFRLRLSNSVSCVERIEEIMLDVFCE